MNVTKKAGVPTPRRRSIADPTPGDVRLTRLATNWLLSPYYARFARSLGLTGGERVIDFGSGSGALARHLAPILVGGQGQLTCIDVSPVWLAVARHALRRWNHVDFRLGDVATLGLEPGTFDVVAIHFVLHDVPSDARQRTVDALSRALRPGGRVELREPLRARHGMAIQEIDDLMLSAGLRPRAKRVHAYPLLGPVLTATYVKGHPFVTRPRNPRPTQGVVPSVPVPTSVGHRGGGGRRKPRCATTGAPPRGSRPASAT